MIPTVAKHSVSLGLATVLLVSTHLASALPASEGKDAVFDISRQVVVASPPHFGVNLSAPAMNHWDTEPWHNQWWLFPNPNPVTARVKGVATGGSATTLENQSGLGFYDVFRDGFFDGGSAAVYRFAHNEVTLVRQSKIATFQASVQGPNRITFDAPGPEVKAGDLYVLTTTRTNFPAKSTRTLASSPWVLCSGLRLPEGDAKKLYDSGVRTILSSDVPPHGGGASLELQIPEGWTTNNPRVSLGNWLISGERADFPRFHEDKTYTLHLWMKQRGMPTGAVDVKIGSLANPHFKVGSQWMEYSADFIAKPPKGTWAEAFEIHTVESGNLLIDNITLVEKEGPPPYGFYPHIIETLKGYQPSSLRLWVLQANNGFGKALDDALGPPEESNLTFHETEGSRTTTPLGLHQMLELCAEVGTDPWIVTSTMFSAQEQKNLIEYLAGPPDSPYGKKRAAWGHKAPWTETFRQIKLEMGNETWNGMFVPQGFPGRGDEYGAYSEFMFRAMKSSPWFHSSNFQFVINGWSAQPGLESWAYGAAALRNAPSAQAIDIAYYTGGWDAVGLLPSDTSENGWMNILAYSRRLLLPLALKFKQTADAIAAEQGRPGGIQCLVYEAGPGYTLPGPGKLNMQEQAQGKSLGQAINTLDIFMNNLRNGYGDQSFFTFKNGHYWSSHNRQWGEQIVWKALALRNQFLEGDLITATPTKMVTLDLPEAKADIVSQSNSNDRSVKTFPAIPQLPLIDCYPFRKGLHYSYMLLSRRLDGPTKVTLNLPYKPSSSYTLYTLTGQNPGVNNIDTESVRVAMQEKEGMTRSFTLELPPYSIMVLTNEEE